MALISKSFPQSTRPSLQTLRHSPAPADKSRKARAKTPLMRPSLQTAPRTAVACVAAVAPQGDCSRSTGDACADMRANSRDCVEPTRAAPAPVLAVVGIPLPLGPLPASPSHTLTRQCTAVRLIPDLRTRPERLVAGRTPPRLHRRPSPPRENLSKARSAPHDYNLDAPT